MDADVCFVHFRSTNLTHLDAAWYSLSKQDFSGIRCVQFFDNNTQDSPTKIMEVLERYELPVPVRTTFTKHGDKNRTHSWSVNRVCAEVPGDRWVVFTRTDYILAFDCIAKLLGIVGDGKQKVFASGWCWQMAYDREARNIDAEVDIEKYGWRERGMSALLEHPYAFRFHETDKDAGVWCTKRHFMVEAGGMNEGLTTWGYQQSVFQRALASTGVKMVAISEYLFAHQHHAADRDFAMAQSQYNANVREKA